MSSLAGFYLIEDSLEDDVDVDERELCDTCNGSGEGYADGSKCQTCRGSGSKPNSFDIRQNEEEP